MSSADKFGLQQLPKLPKRRQTPFLEKQMKRFKTVDDFIAGSERHEELIRLREVLQSLPMDETVKWGSPVYTAHGKNVVGIGAFKSYFGLWFFQGALLQDEQGLLINAQDGKTKAMRQWRMATKKDIKTRLIKSYVREAIALAADGKEIKKQRSRKVVLPAELQAALAQSKRAAKSFERLTPGRQRDYATYIAEAKRDVTKRNRLEKILPMIVEGIGLNDQYRK